MLAAVYSEYGPPERLSLANVPTPVPGPHDILVRVAAVSLNASDSEFLRAKPAYVRAWGLRRPSHPILGSDVAGYVEAVGSKVTKFKEGDRVFADLLERWGGLAQYVAAHERLWASIPEAMSLEQACMVPQSGVVAFQGLHAVPSIAGKSVLINGAGGGSGTFALQLAKWLGAARVTGVDRAVKATEMRRLGADRTIDFASEDYTTQQPDFDLILDLVGSRSLAENARALAPEGQYLLVGGSLHRIFETLTLGPLRSLFGTRKYRLLVVKQSAAAFTHVAELCVQGHVRPVLGQTFPLNEVQDAFRALEAGNVLGKVVVTV